MHVSMGIFGMHGYLSQSFLRYCELWHKKNILVNIRKILGSRKPVIENSCTFKPRLRTELKAIPSLPSLLTYSLTLLISLPVEVNLVLCCL